MSDLLGDLKDPRLIILKGLFFLFLAIFASALILWEHPEPQLAFLLAVAVWSAARFYYFAFYVITHYVDATYRFSSLTSLAIYLWRRWRGTVASMKGPGGGSS